jgi:catechol 2,3-dioxygenase-like lactoylglutathione lyase family enzyme
MRIGLTSIYVDDQDQAERFYTQVLGFNVKTSAPYSNTERWLSVVSPDGVELVLHLAGESARAFQQASRQNGRPVLSLATGETAPGRLSGSRPRGWCSPRSRAACPTAASTRCSTTPAATSSTCTRTDRRSGHAAHAAVCRVRARDQKESACCWRTGTP